MNCPKCEGRDFVKNGIVQRKQRYRCKGCGYNFTSMVLKGKSLDTKRRALILYLEGNGFNAIGRILGVSDVAVLKWIRALGAKVDQLRREIPQPVRVQTMELDEMWHFVRQKNKNSGYGLLMTDLGGNLLLSLWETETK